MSFLLLVIMFRFTFGQLLKGAKSYDHDWRFQISV